ncbi:N-acetylated-alpha-linked acidic dipeptidase 2-like protein [Leptotrombidium deliense]|uniref:Aminopeptidase NAALADL1 n=1 Tax=Leptotrombidium deliense TaxID=299467 RepID=A0A443SP05_9ACAR|nr:N-acetylated-alpha-linked acidic dipeptidase 2-like protein [Leptotrombidium deliense]
MSAQYRPYRDEDHCDGLENDNLNWGDNEPGSIQIYEKTTEDLPFSSNRRFVLSALGVTLITFVVGFVIGYFVHTNHAACIPNISVALHSTKDEDTTISRKIIEKVNAENLRHFVKVFSNEARFPGSERDLFLVKQIENSFRQSHFDETEIKNYTVLLSVPDDDHPNSVEIIDIEGKTTLFSHKIYDAKKKYVAFSAYSPAANITGDIVFVNYGRAQDYQYLQDVYNISVEGKIVIAKQFHLAADEQLLYAQEKNAAALLLYTEPGDYFDEKDAWNIPPDAIRSDSLLWNGLGDPQTPGIPSTESALRLPLNAINILPKIPVQPISIATAYELLGLMGGKPVPKDWAGVFNFTYRLGAGFQNTSLKLRLQVNNKYVNRTIHNVIGYMKGHVEPDRYVILGNHRDSWVNGAIDAAGGSAVFMELINVFGELRSRGWKPRRTIMFCSWGADEYNLIGSTEWLEENYKILYSRAVAYINADVVVLGNGSITADASPLLYNVLYNATKEVPNPDTNDEHKTVYDKWLYTFPTMHNYSQLVVPITYFKNNFIQEEVADYHNEVFGGNEENEMIDDIESPSLFRSYLNSATIQIRPKIRQLNTRSVFTSFFSNAGIPSIEMTYVPFASHEDADFFLHPLIHSQYDDFELVDSVIDPSFKCHKAVTQVIGEVIRDLSDSLFIPFNLLHYAQVLKDLSSALHIKVLSNMKLKDINIMTLESAVHNFTKAALNFHYHQEKADLKDPMAIRRINDQLLLLERALLHPSGLPRNRMKKHIIMSPSETSSPYDDTFPGLMDEFAVLIESSFLAVQSWDILKKHFADLIYTIQTAANILNDMP